MDDTTDSMDAVVDEEVEETIDPEATADESGEPEASADYDYEGEDEDAEQEEELEFVFGGNKFKAPKDAIPEEIADGLDKFSKGIWSDYTKKSQDIAETQRQLEARASVVQKLESLHGEVLDTYSKGLAVRSELEQLSGIDLGELWQSDPDQARRVSDLVSQKQAQFQSIVQEVSRQEQAIDQEQFNLTKERLSRGKAIIEKSIKGFEAKAPEVVDYVVQNYGIPKHDAEAWPINPPAAIMAYKAMMYDRLQSKANNTRPKVTEAKPVKAIRSKGGRTVKDPGKMSPDEYEAWFMAQKKKKKAF